MSENTKPNDGGPAFPCPEGNGCAPWGGMTLRDWFAGQALKGLLANPGKRGTFDDYADDAWKHADAALKARGE